MTPLEHRDIATNGVTLHVVLAGPPAGRPVLLLHGFPDFWYGWHAQIAPLARAGFRVIVPDQRGYNTSDKPRGVASYARDVLADDMVGLLDALGHPKAAVVGHDWGGVVAWWLAHGHADRVERLVVLNCPHPGVFGRALRTNRRQLARSWYMGFFQIPWLPEAMLGRRGAALLARVMPSGSFSADDLARYREAWTRPGALRAMIDWYRAGARVRAGRPPTRTVAAPTLLIWGEKDPFLGAELAEPSIARCDDGRLERIVSAGHWVQLDAPAEVNALLVSFLGA